MNVAQGYAKEEARAATAGKINNYSSSIEGPDVLKYCQALGEDVSIWNVSNMFSYNMTMPLHGTNYKLKNIDPLSSVYSTHDVIAASLKAGYSEKEIASALNKTNIPNPITQGSTTNGKIQPWTAAAVTAYNINSTSIGQQLQEIFGNDTKVQVLLDKDGVNYSYKITYNNGKASKTLSSTEIAELTKDSKGKIKSDELDGLLDDKGLTTYTNTNAAAALENNIATRDSLIKQLKDLGYTIELDENNDPKLNPDGTLQYSGNLKVNLANAAQNLIDADRAAITANYGTTDGLDAYNQIADTNILGGLVNNPNGMSIDPNKTNANNTLERVTLQQLIDAANEGNQATIDSAINNANFKSKNLISAIKQDPELYNSIIQQLRQDAAAGTIAGQQAANTSKIAKAANESYNTQTDELYSQLFGENNIANQVRTANQKSKTDDLATYIQGQLNDAQYDLVEQPSSQISILEQRIGELIAAGAYDIDKFKNYLTQEVGLANAEAEKIVSNATAYATQSIGNSEASADYKSDLASQLANLYSNASTSDVASAIRTLQQASNNSNINTGYTTVDAGTQQTPTEFTNANYEAILNDPIYKQILTKEFRDQYTKETTLQDIVNSITDEQGNKLLTQDALTQRYNQYAAEANADSDQVFNAAQRAYIASIAAGDVKTTEQLTKLAQTAGASKGNLYATSALANQYNQQQNNINVGRTLANDYYNQQIANLQNKANVTSSVANAQNTFYGTPGASYNSGSGATVYGIKSGADQNTINANKLYSNLGMQSIADTSTLNSSNAEVYAGNVLRNAQTAGSLTEINAKVAASNASTLRKNKTTADSLLSSLAANTKTLAELRANSK